MAKKKFSSKNAVLDLDSAQLKIRQLRKKNLSVGMSHGCFDVLHFGHLEHLERAASQCDYLFVTVTADRYVAKGPDRPIFPAERRAQLLAGLKCVQFVVISEFETAIPLLRELRPNYYFKGNDYRLPSSHFAKAFEEEVAAAAEIGTKTVMTDEDTYSSTRIIERLRS